MATDYDYQLNPPRKVKQQNTATCWAAAFESLLASLAYSPQKTEKELVKEYGVQSAGGGIRVATLEDIARKFGFIFNSFDAGSAASVFTDRFILERLKKSGPILAAAYVTNQGATPWFHAQVIWGVEYQVNQDVGTGLALLDTMDPAGGKYAMYLLQYFTQHVPLFTCWRNA
jgi:hypothetical protein